MHIVCVSYFCDRRLETPDALLAAYLTLTGWAEGVAAAGAEVSVVQRFQYDACRTHKGVRYHFVASPSLRQGSVMDGASRINRAIAYFQPDVIHVNGLSYARQAWLLKRRLPSTPILIQDHANRPPSRWPHSLLLRSALNRMDGVSFTAKAQADLWRQAGYLPETQPLFELMEGSSRFRLLVRSEAREQSGLHGDPLCLWVGRLDANKDPLMVLEGFAQALPQIPGMRLAMVYGEDALLPAVREWLAAHPQIAQRVRLLGRLPHDVLETVYNSADLFVLGSHREGSGYAALEALSCGVVPVLTDIPSFRMLLREGSVGALWPVGDPEALAQALIIANADRTPETPHQFRAFFEQHWSFEAIGRQALAAYTHLLQTARTGYRA